MALIWQDKPRENALKYKYTQLLDRFSYLKFSSFKVCMYEVLILGNAVLRLESTKRNAHLWGQLTFDEGGKTYNGVKTVSSVNGVGRTGQTHAKKWN